MSQLSITPSITVTIGQHTCLYFAFVTTAPVDLDSPSTMTLHASTFSDVAGFAADPITHEELRGRTPARLVLVDAMELALAARTHPRESPPASACGSRARRPQHPAALVVATPPGAHCQ